MVHRSLCYSLVLSFANRLSNSLDRKISNSVWNSVSDFPGLSWPWYFQRLQAIYFVECPSVWVCSLLPDVGQGRRRCEAVCSLPLHDFDVPYCWSSRWDLVMRAVLPGFSTGNWLFPPSQLMRLLRGATWKLCTYFLHHQTFNLFIHGLSVPILFSDLQSTTVVIYFNTPIFLIWQ